MKLINEKSIVWYKNQRYNFEELVQCLSLWKKHIMQLKSNKILIYLQNELYVLLGIMATLNSDKAYIPIDVRTPIDRVKHILEQTKSAIITDGENVTFFKEYEVCIPKDIISDNESNNVYTNVIGKGLAYIIYTSGSTGAPKGVCIGKNALVNFIAGACSCIDFTGITKTVCLTSCSFDMYIVETFLMLYLGMEIFVGDVSIKRNSRKLLNFISEKKIDFIQSTPSRLRILMSEPGFKKLFESVKVLIVGGDKFPRDIVKADYFTSEIIIYNGYGPTEATVYISIKRYSEKSGDISKPLDNNNFVLLPCENGNELCIQGANLSDGYFKDDEKTKEKFIYIDGKRTYKTGDLCVKINGDLWIRGRIDNQIKINGYRVELEEIEKNILELEQVRECIVYVKTMENGIQYLEALYTKHTKFDNMIKFREYLEKKLPLYMIPHSYKQIGEFVYTISGKINRERTIERMSRIEEIKKSIVELINEILEDASVSMENCKDDFRDIMIDSLAYVRLIVSLEDFYQITFNDEFLDNTRITTIDKLAEVVYEIIEE